MYPLLIVDDEEEILSSLSVYYPWGELGFVVVAQASSLAEATAAAAEHSPAAVLSDVRMHDGTGLDLAARLSALPRPPKIVLLSAYRKFEYAQEALRYGVRSYLLKPPNYDELCSVFRAVKAELDAEEADAARSPLETVVGTVKAYAKGNLRTATLEEAARSVDMSPNYLSTYFREKTGEGFGDFLIRCRMEKACRLLADPRSNVESVSSAVGYSSPKNFSRAFKAYYGATPRDYRGGPAAGAASADSPDDSGA